MIMFLNSWIKEVLNGDSIFFWQTLERNNLKNNIGIPHAPSEHSETHKDQYA